MKKNIILFNPSSGRGRSLKNLEKIRSALSELENEFIVTKSEEHLRALVHQYASEKSLIAVGGDSTVTIVADEILKGKHSIPLGLIPTGSSDDIALDYEIGSIQKAAAAVIRGRILPTDAGKIQGDGVSAHFLGQANVGLGVSVNRGVARAVAQNKLYAKNRTLAGLIAMRRAYRKREVPVSAHIVHPEENIDGQFISILFSKIRYWAGGLLYAPGAKPADGDLHAVLIRSCSFFRLLQLTRLAQTGKHISQKEILSVSAKKFRLRLNSPFQIQVDGDIVKEGKAEKNFSEAEFEVIPAALRIFR